MEWWCSSRNYLGNCASLCARRHHSSANNHECDQYNWLIVCITVSYFILGGMIRDTQAYFTYSASSAIALISKSWHIAVLLCGLNSQGVITVQHPFMTTWFVNARTCFYGHGPTRNAMGYLTLPDRDCKWNTYNVHPTRPGVVKIVFTRYGVISLGSCILGLQVCNQQGPDLSSYSWPAILTYRRVCVCSNWAGSCTTAWTLDICKIRIKVWS